jgi:F-type H+-transporting ATPase subunit delta
LPPLGAGGIAVAHRIYAEALFSAAKDGGRLAQVHEAFADFAAALEQSPELAAVLRNPQLEPTAKAGILHDLVGDDEPLFTNFLQLVSEKGRAGELEQIAQEFERLMAREERRLTVELTTARELTDAEAAEIVKQIEDAAGRTVEATRSVDPGILGGIVLQAGSYRADASVRGRLERLRQTLVRS